MDSKELRNLQEAYMGVYQEQELDEAEGSYGQTPKALERAKELTKKRILAPQGNIFSKRNNKKINKRAKGIQDVTKHLDRMSISHRTEQVDLYDIILSHLLDEGYAETQEAAEAMMVNMSEEWRDSILSEGEKPLPYGRMMKKSNELADSDDKKKRKRAAHIYLAANSPKGPKVKIRK